MVASLETDLNRRGDGGEAPDGFDQHSILILTGGTAATLDPIIQALTGVISVIGEADGIPMMIGAPLSDVIAGIYAAHAVLAGFFAVRAGEPGRYNDICMQDAMLTALGLRMGGPLGASGMAEQREPDAPAGQHP